MKNYKKVIALLMTASMTLGLAACGDKDKDTQKDTNKPENPGNGTESQGGDTDDKAGPYTIQIDPSTGQAYDLGGMDIIVRDWWTVEEDPNKEKSGYEKARDEYLKWAQDTYKFTIKTQAISSWASVFTDLEEYVTTGGDENNYIYTMRIAGELISQMRSGLYYDLTTLKSIDMNGEKWDPVIKNFGTVGDKVYLMRKMDHEPRTGVFFNKRILRENGIDPAEIYELQRTHKWTWDKFVEYLEMLTKDTDADGVIDQYGFLEGNSLNGIAVASNNGNLVGFDSSTGKYTYELESENTLEAVNWAVDIRDKYNMPNPDVTAENWFYYTDAFKAGNAAFLVQQMYYAGQDLPDMEDDFGFVAFPMGPKADTYVDLNEDNVHVIPACYDEDKANKLAFAYNIFYNPVPDYEDYSDYYAGALKAFRDMESVEETLSFMGEKTVMMMDRMIPGLDVSNTFWYQVNKENTAAAQAEQVRDSWKAYIESANETIGK